MCSKLLSVLSLLALCTAEPPQSAAAHSSPHHAVSSQSYNRGDVPLSYKYSAVHIYTTPKPGQYKEHVPQYHYEQKNHYEQRNHNDQINHNEQGNHNEQRNYNEQPAYYQYAPVQPPTELYTKVAQETNEAKVSYHGNSEKSPLEPQEQDEPSHYRVQSYVPGQNVHVLPSVARRPDYNAWYKPHQVAVPEKLNQSVPLNHHQVYHNVHQFLPSTEKSNYEQTHAAPENTIVFAVVPKQYKQQLHMQAEQAKGAPMVFFNVAKAKAYSYPYSPQQVTFPHYQQDIKQLQHRLNEPKHSAAVKYVYVQKAHNYYVTEHQH